LPTLCTAVALAVGSATPAPAAGLLAAIGEARIVGPGTLDVGTRRIRLQDVHIPDGASARSFLARMIDGEAVVCFDSGRRVGEVIVGRCDVDGRDLGHSLVEAGVALACPSAPAAQGLPPGCV
jgi:endonuclease YncB( thermonuclease family)